MLFEQIIGKDIGIGDFLGKDVIGFFLKGKNSKIQDLFYYWRQIFRVYVLLCRLFYEYNSVVELVLFTSPLLKLEMNRYFE